jgi:dipeptidyl aminopeptidase/acylaminoacyl peptidase
MTLILSGVDALIRDGIVDPMRLSIGGYSYGAYLTNWLIIQTTPFNAAVSGAGSVENVADWGLTDEPLTSIYFFGGYPWQVPNLYEKEASIFQMDKVRTPTHIVVPGGDNRVSSGESFILERALTSLGIPTKLIILPGEPHGLGNNPWHEKIKLREELKWLQKYVNIN